MLCWKCSITAVVPYTGVWWEVGPLKARAREQDSCLTHRNELSEETHVLTKQEILLGSGTWVESSRVREPRRTALSYALQSLVLW